MKIDLHLHLDGAITVEIAKKLAGIQGIELPTEDYEKLKKLLTVPEDCANLNDFLNQVEFLVYLPKLSVVLSFFFQAFFPPIPGGYISIITLQDLLMVWILKT